MERAGSLFLLADSPTREAPPPTPQLHQEHSPQNETQPVQDEKAKRYSRSKIVLGLIQSVLLFSFTVIVVSSGLTGWLEQVVRGYSGNDYVVLLAFSGILGLSQAVLAFPLRFFSGYHLEHRYGLSNQSISRWFRERLKATLIGLPLAVPILILLFYSLRNFGQLWWLPVGVMVFLFSVVLARLAPTLIFPLFYKFTALSDGALKEKIIARCREAGMNVSGVFVFNMSKNTKKANAAFAGIGKSRRILLGDTLVANFTDDEIETVFAHELGHFKLRHLWLMMGVGTLSTFLGLFLTAELYAWSLTWFGFTSVGTIAALPLLGLWLGLYSILTTPLSNLLSRVNEYAADRFAVRMTGKKQDFVNALTKLSRVNLADASPHPLIEVLWYSHPSIDKRIRALEGA